MEIATFPSVRLGDLPDHAFVRLEGGDVGVIHDRVHNPRYSKVCVEVPGSRQPIRILAVDTMVEHLGTALPKLSAWPEEK